MIVSRHPCLAAALALLAACSPAPTAPPHRGDSATIAPSPAPSPSAAPRPDYAGRWTGVEGMVLDVLPGKTSDRYRLTMQYDLDHKQSVDAARVGDTLVFTRDGATRTLRPTDATGLKYLAGKKDCLTVAAGEGYCRD